MAPYSVLQNRNCGILLQLYKLDTGYILNKNKKKHQKFPILAPPPPPEKHTPRPKILTPCARQFFLLLLSFFSLAIRFIRAEVGLTGPRSPPPAAAPPLDESAFSSPSSAVLITRNAFEVNFCP